MDSTRTSIAPDRLAAALVLVLALGAGPAGAASDDVVYFTVDRIVVTGDNPLAEARTAEILAPYLGEQAGLLGLENAADALQRAMRAEGYTFHRVVLPPQRARRVFELRALEFTLGDIVVEGNEHFSRDSVVAMLPSLVPGETPDSRRVTRDVQVANRHPSKRLALTMRTGSEPDSVDALVSVRDESPGSFFLSANNRGSRDSGEERLTVGYQRSDVFRRDHVLTASYTTAPGKWEDVRQYGLTYRMPIYSLASSLTLVGSYSDVDAGLVADFFDVTGQGTVIGLVGRHALLNRGRYTHAVELSLMDKQFQNDVDFLGQPIGQDVRSRPVSLRYSGEFLQEAGNFGFDLAYVRNTPNGADNTGFAYAATRAGADTDWDLLRLGATVDRRLEGGWLLRSRLAVQWADEPLIPGEQFGMGGAGSVRGFFQREASADDGVSGSVELWIPPPRDDLQVLGFVDAARGWRDQAQVGEESTPELVSLGAGMRWQPLPWLSANVDWGYVLDGVAGVEGGNHRFHFTLTSVF